MKTRLSSCFILFLRIIEFFSKLDVHHKYYHSISGEENVDNALLAVLRNPNFMGGLIAFLLDNICPGKYLTAQLLFSLYFIIIIHLLPNTGIKVLIVFFIIIWDSDTWIFRSVDDVCISVPTHWLETTVSLSHVLFQASLTHMHSQWC